MSAESAGFQEDRTRAPGAIPGTDFVSDFKIAGTYVEVVGMMEIPKYRERHVAKMTALSQMSFRIMILLKAEVNALFDPNELLLIPSRNSQCADCQKPTVDLVYEVCRPCYMKRWHHSHSEERICFQCKQTFSGDESQKFCSHACYARSLELAWPPWGVIDQKLRSMNVPQLARELGVKPGSLYMRLHRRGMRAAQNDLPQPLEQKEA